MNGFVRCGQDGLLPEDLAVFAIHADEDAIARRVLILGIVPFNATRDEDPIAPDDGRRMTAAGYLGLPGAVLGGRPFAWPALIFGGAASARSAPAVPVLGRGRHDHDRTGYHS